MLPNQQCFIRTAVLLPVGVWIKPILMRRKILVVEDDPDQLEAIRGNLKDAGFAIGTAANGVDALIKTRSVSPDLIVLDLMLPQLNGLDICKTLAGKSRHGVHSGDHAHGHGQLLYPRGGI